MPFICWMTCLLFLVYQQYLTKPFQASVSLTTSYTFSRAHFYQPQRSCGQGNVFTGVCLSTGGGRVSASVHAGMPYPPRWRNPPGWRTPPPGPGRPPRMENPPPGTRQTPPSGSRLQHTVYERPIRILLECILVFDYFLMYFNRNTNTIYFRYM